MSSIRFNRDRNPSNPFGKWNSFRQIAFKCLGSHPKIQIPDLAVRSRHLLTW